VTTPDHPEVAEGDACPALPGRDPRQETRDTLRVPRLLVVRGGDYMSDESGPSVACAASVATDKIDAGYGRLRPDRR